MYPLVFKLYHHFCCPDIYFFNHTHFSTAQERTKDDQWNEEGHG